MSPKRLIVATVILAALAGAVYWSNQNEAAKEGQRAPDAPPLLLELPEADIAGIEVALRDQTPTVLGRTGEDDLSWEITAPALLPADQGVIAAMTSTVNQLESLRVVDEAPTELASYGLDPAAVAVTFTMAGGETHTLKLGDDTTDGEGAFATVSDDPALYTIAVADKTKFDKTTLELRNPDLLSFNADQLTGMTYSRAGQQSITLTKEDDRWRIARPRSLPADNLTVQSFIAALAQLKLDPQIEARFSEEGFASGDRWATITLDRPEGDIDVEIRESLGQYIVRTSQVEGVYQVNPSAGTDFNKTLEDFRDKKLFDFGFDTPTGIEYTSDGETRSIGKVDNDWIERGGVVDSLAMQTLFSRLRDIATELYEGRNFGQPEIEITVTSEKDNQETMEQVSIAPGGSGYLAKRAGDPQIYQISEAAVSGLRQAIAAVREAPPPEDNAEKAAEGAAP